MIPKKPQDTEAYQFNWRFFASARDGLREILRQDDVRGKSILLPAYIGVSPNEGSGIMDPIREAGNYFEFYRLNDDLTIRDGWHRTILDAKRCVLFIVHVFGFYDPRLMEIRDWAKGQGMTIIEDFAHAFFTFWQCSYLAADYAMFSLHKMFPVPVGGAVLGAMRPRLHMGRSVNRYNRYNFHARLLANTNMDEIIRSRGRNETFLRYELFKHGTSLRESDPMDIGVPQSFPILLKDRATRDRAYHELTDAGFGVTSLWHTLVPEIGEEYDTEHDVSGRILNLPCHQDCRTEDLKAMVEMLVSCIKS